MNTQQKLDDLKQKIVDDKVCPELAEQATQLVFGDGNADPEIVFIGEAPGKNEDEKGLPFVGAAGKFLDEMLESIGLNRKDIYITNIVKYRPPNNRDPLPEEKKAFLPYLQTQLEIIQPKIVVTLGRHSTNCFLPDLQISRAHGQPKRIRINMKHVGDQREDGVQGDNENRGSGTKGTTTETRKQSTQQSASKKVSGSSSAGSSDELTLVILPLYHPAAALYNGSMRQTLLEDFSKIPMILEKI